MMYIGRVDIELEKPTNYIPMGQWQADVEYKLSDVGIPVVEVPDSTAAGFSVYALNVDVATKGLKPDANNSEWKLMESAEFIYMLQAYIKRLQSEIITAQYIESLMIRTRNLEVLDGAKIGGFKISGDGLTNKDFNNDAYIIMRNDVKDASGNYLYGTFVGIGGNVLPSMLGGIRAVGKFSNTMKNPNSPNYGIIVEASGGSRNIGLQCVGDISLKGSLLSVQSFHFSAGYSNSIYDNINEYRLFCFEPPSGVFNTVYLPSKTQLAEALGSNLPDYWYIDIEVQVSVSAQGAIALTGQNGGHLRDNNGSIPQLGVTNANGGIRMEAGDSIKLRFRVNSASWSIINLQV